MNYEFVLKFQLPTDVQHGDALIDALAEAGCDDATVGTGAAGRLALEFDREADSAWAAVTSAISAVRNAVPGARLIEVGPDIVGLSDVAAVLGVSRQYARKLLVESARQPPLEIHGGQTSLWHLQSVLEWLAETGRAFPRDLVDVATTARCLNVARDAAQVRGVTLDPDLRAVVGG